MNNPAANRRTADPIPAVEVGEDGDMRNFLIRRRNYLLAAAAVLVFWLYGAVHVFYGKGLGLGTCWKRGWTLSNTFVDVADIRPPEGQQELPEKVLDAAERCTLAYDADAWGRDKILLLILATFAVIGPAFLIMNKGTRPKEEK